MVIAMIGSLLAFLDLGLVLSADERTFEGCTGTEAGKPQVEGPTRTCGCEAGTGSEG
jgi:hypothetical protein